jgi:acyl-CoA reductase-like NAD-dependent aldehyde dehydrogenase
MTLEKEFTTHSPLDGEKIGTYKIMDKQEVDAIITKAHKTQEQWSNISIDERIFYLNEMIKVIAENAENYAEKIHKDTGKTLIEALTTEIVSTLGKMDYYAKNAKKILKNKKVDIPIFFAGKKCYSIFEPIGVVGIISPWNYPFSLAFVPVISAILPGNTVVLKVSSQAPVAGRIIEDIVKKSGLPEGVINLVWGKGLSGQYIAEGNIQKLFFTGSTDVGRKLAKICADRLIPVVLELGGSDPCIILEGADLYRAARGVVYGSLVNSGQLCVSIERIYVTQKDHDQFIDQLKTGLKEVKMGEDVECDIGAMTVKSQIEKIKAQLEDALEKGAEIIFGGNVQGNFMEPTLIINCNHEMCLINEETFGPVIAVIKTQNDEESLRLANDSKYGLCSSIYGDSKKAYLFAKKIQSGNVNINNSILSFAIPSLPFGGVKESGIGRYHGPDGLYAFCNTKSIMEDRFTFLKEDVAWLPYGKDAFKNYLRFLEYNWGRGSPLKYLYMVPLMFKKKNKDAIK